MEVPCSACEGTGLFEGQPCLQCGGDGLMDVAGVHEVTYGYVLAEHANILAVIEKVDAILVEQVSQREDLTAALTSIINEQASQRTDLTATLTAIWDKVKGL